MSWLSGVERIQAHSLFKQELFSVAGVEIDAADAPDVHQPNAQSTGIGAKIALDAFFDFDACAGFRSSYFEAAKHQEVC